MNWLEKYRPFNFTSLLIDQDKKTLLMNFVKNKDLPHMIFHGPPGTGKTSCAYIIAYKLFGESLSKQVLELNASDDRGIKAIREKIKNFVLEKQTKESMKIIILDEADSLTLDSQFALRRIIEDNSKSIRFMIICNYINKIIEPIKSRCMMISFESLSKELFEKCIDRILEKEKIKKNPQLIEELYKYTNGDLRKSINMLYNVYVLDDEMKSETLKEISDYVPNKIIDDLFVNEFDNKQMLGYCKMLMKKNYSYTSIINSSIDYIMEKIEDDKIKSELLIKMADFEYQLLSKSDYLVQLLMLILFIKIKTSK